MRRRICFLAPPKYTATAQVIATFNATQENGESTDISQQNTGGTYISSQIKSYPTLTTTEKVLSPVIAKFGLNESVANLAGRLVVTNPSNTAFVNISAKDGDAKNQPILPTRSPNRCDPLYRMICMAEARGNLPSSSPLCRKPRFRKAQVPRRRDYTFPSVWCSVLSSAFSPRC